MEELSSQPSTTHSQLSSEKEQNYAPLLQISSLPCLLSGSLSSQDVLHWNSSKIIDQWRSNSSTLVEDLTLTSINHAKIYKKLHIFLQDLIENPLKLNSFLEDLREIEKKYKQQFIRSKRSMVRLKQAKSYRSQIKFSQLHLEGDQMNSRIFKTLLQHQESCDNISLKLINSKSNMKLSKAPSIRQMINLACIITFKDSVVLQSIQSEDSLDNFVPLQIFKSHSHLQKMHSFKEQDKENCCGPKVRFAQNDQVIEYLYKQSSIMMIQQNREEEVRDRDFSSDNSLCADPQLPNIPFNQKIIREYFDPPEIFFMNFALCLFFKCLTRNKLTLTIKNITVLLGISTFVSYKAYYDETIQGLMEHFSNVLQLSTSNIKLLERWFLQQLNYEVGINNRHYQQVMFRVISQST